MRPTQSGYDTCRHVEPGPAFSFSQIFAASFSRPSHLKCPFSSVFSRTKSLSQKSFSASFDTDDQHRPSALLVRRYSISAAAASSPPLQLPLASKVQSGFEPRKSSSTSASFDADDQHQPSAPLVRRYSISAAAAASSPPSQLPLASKVQRLADNVQSDFRMQLARQDYLEVPQRHLHRPQKEYQAK
ncbi:uncharacterized protein LOC104439529 [Eucalyptus grandis]|uniref:uncharacterized protein LOC104439529 n=1 Tax=Eucalyptus grandis TaxID=71139 RepID=UPI00192EF01C|nr:uncharacterized protein LOC104439529 [Eucalyptus grandis]